MRSESSFEIDGDLIIVEAIVVGPNGKAVARLVLDTGSPLTTLVPRIAEAIGYSSANRVARSVVPTRAAPWRCRCRAGRFVAEHARLGPEPPCRSLPRTHTPRLAPSM